MGEVKEPLRQVIIKFSVVVGSLFRKFPFLFFVAIGILGVAIYSIFSSKEGMQIFLCVLISLTAFIIYMNTANYGETILSFLLGILTIFTINWDTNNAHIFIITFVLFNAVLFIGNSIKLSSQIESILAQAASFIDVRRHNAVYKQLKDLMEQNTQFQQLGAINKAECIRFLAFLRVPISEMKPAIDAIEVIKVLNQVELNQALNFFRAVYFLKERTPEPTNFNAILDTFVNQINSIPLTPEEFLRIFDKTKKVVLSHKMTLQEYFQELRTLLLNGADEEEIISEINKVSK